MSETLEDHLAKRIQLFEAAVDELAAGRDIPVEERQERSVREVLVNNTRDAYSAYRALRAAGEVFAVNSPLIDLLAEIYDTDRAIFEGADGEYPAVWSLQ